MSAKRLRGIGLMIFALAALVACGGGGGTQMAGGGIGGTGVSFGTVTQFGSIFVNGVEFDTDSATVTLNGDPGPDVGTDPHRGLKKGMVVRVNGSFDDKIGTAADVEFEDNVEGPVCDNQQDATKTVTTLRVLGQTVVIDDTTNVDDNIVGGVAALGPNDVVEVSGLPDANGVIHATFIELKPQAADVEVKGRVTTVNTGGFEINDLVVLFSNGIPGVGDFVEVKGTLADVTCNVAVGKDQLMASSVEAKPEGAGDITNGDRAEIEGFVTSGANTQFSVGNQQVDATSAIFVGGVANDIAVGVKVEVEGVLSGGVLIATKVEFEDGVGLESNVTGASGSTITLEGLPGVVVTANVLTELKLENGTMATIDDLTPLNGHNVRIRGRAAGPTAPTSVIATDIEDRGPAVGGADVILQGPTTDVDVANLTFKILAVTVDTSMLGPDDFKGVDDLPMMGGADAFFNALTTNGVLVKAKGRLNTGTDALAAGNLKEVELED